MHRGGMGEIAEVTAPDGRRLALKRMPPSLLAGVTEIERFRREIRLLASLEMEGVPRVEAYDDDPGEPYLLMEWVEGDTFEARFAALRERPVAERVAAAVELGRGLAEVLEQVHDLRVFHRDLSPRNVVVRPDGGVVLLDFGLARHEDRSLVTQSGDLLGTLRYAPPEQVGGSGRLEPTPSGDLYALGLLLFECVAGRPARCGEDRATLVNEALLFDPPDLGAVVAGVPPAFRRVLASLLARDPRDRYARGSELARDLAALAQGAGPTAPKPPWHRRLLRAWRRLRAPQRRRLLATSLATVLLLGAAVSSWLLLPRRWAAEAARSPRFAVASPLLDRAAAWRPSAEHLLQKALTELAFGETEAARATLGELEEAPEWREVAVALRHWEEHARAQGSEWQRADRTQCGEDHSGLIPLLERARSEHDGNAWLAAWLAWVEFSTHDSPDARSWLQSAIALAPHTHLFHRALIWARIQFGTTSEDLLPLLADAREQVPSAEWDLWEAWATGVLGWELRDRSGEPGPQARALLARAAPHCGPGSGLAALEQAVRAHLAHQGGLPFEEAWLPSRDPLVHWLRAFPRLARGEAVELERQALVTGFRPADLGRMLNRGPVAAPPEGSADAPSTFAPDLSSLAGLARDFRIEGDPLQLRFADGGVWLVPAGGDLEDQRESTPAITAVAGRLPATTEWQLEVELAFVGHGDYGSAFRIGPFHLVQDHVLRMELGPYGKEVAEREGWRRLRVRRSGELFEVWLDGELQLANRLPGQPATAGLGIGKGAPKADVSLGLRGLCWAAGGGS